MTALMWRSDTLAGQTGTGEMECRDYEKFKNNKLTRDDTEGAGGEEKDEDEELPTATEGTCDAL